MNTQNNSLRTYCRRVSRLLPWGGRQKRALLAQLRQELTAFLRDHPEAGEAELTARFGKPEDLAASYVENAGTKKVLTALRTRRRVCGYAPGGGAGPRPPFRRVYAGGPERLRPVPAALPGCRSRLRQQ